MCVVSNLVYLGRGKADQSKNKTSLCKTKQNKNHSVISRILLAAAWAGRGGVAGAARALACSRPSSARRRAGHLQVQGQSSGGRWVSGWREGGRRWAAAACTARCPAPATAWPHRGRSPDLGRRSPRPLPLPCAPCPCCPLRRDFSLPRAVTALVTEPVDPETVTYTSG